MVQMFQQGQSPRGRIAEQLGQSLGQGLSSFMGSYLANKAAEGVTTSKDYKEAPLSEKQSLLASKLMPYGQFGEKQFQTRIGAEQQAEQERTSKQQQGILAKILGGKEVSDQERSMIPLPVQIAAAKAMAPKAPPGGLSGQPVPPQVSQAIPQILNQNKEATADELAQEFDKAGIPRAYSNSFIENRRRMDEAKAKDVGEEKKLDLQSFKDNKDYTEKVLSGYEAYKRDKQVLNQMESLSEKGTLSSPLAVASLQKLGLPLGLLENPDSEQFDKLSQELLKNIQNTFGSRILQSEIQSFMRSIPTLLNSEEGRSKLIKQWKIFNESKRAYYDAYKDIRKEYPKRLPPDLHEKVLDKVDDRLDKLGEEFKAMNSPSSIKMIGPDGKARMIPMEQKEAALKAGGKLVE